MMKLKGNSGLIYDTDGKLVMHIAAPYDANNGVFAIKKHDDWERMSVEDAEKKGLEIIGCCQCDKPATQVDHYWPYHTGQNLCDEHEYDPDIDE